MLSRGAQRWRTRQAIKQLGPGYTGVAWNPADKGSDVVLSNSNLTEFCAIAATTNGRVRGTTSHNTGKWYFECQVNTINTATNSPGIGVATAGLSLNSTSGIVIGGAAALGATAYPAPTAFTNTGAPLSLAVNFLVNDVWGVAVDVDLGLIWWSRGGTFVLGGDPAAGTGANNSFVAATPVFPLAGGRGGVTGRFTTGQFTFTPPAGFSAW